MGKSGAILPVALVVMIWRTDAGCSLADDSVMLSATSGSHLSYAHPQQQRAFAASLSAPLRNLGASYTSRRKASNP